MTAGQIAVIVVCLIGGFAFVSALLQAYEKGRAPAASSPAAGGPTDGSPRAWWDTLGVDRFATEAEVRAAYRRLMALCHPDRVAHMSDPLRRIAEAHAVEINAALELALQEMRQR
jgi:DnaJ-domain-containing protein 1